MAPPKFAALQLAAAIPMLAEFHIKETRYGKPSVDSALLCVNRFGDLD